MWLIRSALRRPISIVVVAMGVALCAILAITRMPIDIFPTLDLPVIYVAQPYGGMSPAQMEGYLTYYYEYHFLYITGIQSVESKSIQNVGLLKLTFHPGTDMGQALAETVSYVNRARAFMPPGTVPPFIMRFDAGSVPVGYLVFSSKNRTLGEIQDLALNRVRPLFATLPGVSAPPPFGGNARTIVITVDPEKLRSYQMSPQEVVQAVSSGNVIIPAGNISTGDLWRITPSNAVVSDIKDLLDLPIRPGSGPTVFLRDVGKVEDASDILAGYALVNGQRAIYIPVTKRADASTLAVINEVKRSLPQFKAVVPQDIDINLEFDQSSYVRNALGAVIREGLLGAILTGLMVFLFLRDWRSSVIVMITIPFALLSAIVALWLAGQTINIMTLGGLALAVGILVDQATVAIENIHTHLALAKPKARAVTDASVEVVVPLLLAMLCVLAVFAPSFLMRGVVKSLFVPLSLAVAFAMLASFLLAGSVVPITSIWFLREHQRDRAERPWLVKTRVRLSWLLDKIALHRRLAITSYAILTIAIIILLAPRLGREIFPASTAGQFQLRFRAPTGTRVDVTERITRKVLDEINKEAGRENVQITLGYVGSLPPAYPINTIFLWTSGPHEAVLRVALRPGSHVGIAELQAHLRKVLPELVGGVQFSFEAGDIVSQIMNFGAPTPIEVAITGPNLGTNRAYADKLTSELKRVTALRDLEFEQPLEYPSLSVKIDRELSGQLGVTVKQVGEALVDATSSSRFVTPVYWADPNSGVAYQVQVQFPQPRMTSLQDLENVPVMPGKTLRPLLSDVAQVSYGTVVGEYDRFNGQRMVSLSANVVGEDLGRASGQVDAAIKRAGDVPRGVNVAVRGQIQPMRETLTNLGTGLILAVLVIFLLLAANFQSVRLAFIVLSTVPAVIAGVILMLLFTGTTLNIQSFMGAIMAIGVAVANAILLIVFAERYRVEGENSMKASIRAVQTRMRPILMTSFAMIAGMIPMALAIGSGAEETAPLGRAVIGGLIAATLATLIFLPSIFSAVQRRAGIKSVSLDPDDPGSRFGSSDPHRDPETNS